MAHLFSAGDTKFFIGSAKSFEREDFTDTDFTTETWTEVKGITNLGKVGDESTLGTSNEYGVKRTRKFKGTRDAGNIELVCDMDPDDDGQVALIAAEQTDDSYACKIEFNDAPDGGTPSIRYFTGFVMTSSEQFDEANDAVKFNATIAVDSNVVRVAAAEA